MSSVLVEEYRVRLRKLVTSVTDYRMRKALPAAWSPGMQAYRMSVESEASSLMLSPGGKRPCLYYGPADIPLVH